MAPTSLRSLLTSATLIALFVAFGLGTAGCTADEDVLLGGDGEVCHDHIDCRLTHDCVNFICQPLDSGILVLCEQVCDRFDQCGVVQEACVPACNNTVRQWGDDAKESFRSCLVEDLTCDELLEAENAPQICYNRLELPDDRWARCQEFIGAVRECDGSEEIAYLRHDCRYFARTRSEEVWAETDACVERLEDNVCPDIYDCLNQVFTLDPPLGG